MLALTKEILKRYLSTDLRDWVASAASAAAMASRLILQGPLGFGSGRFLSTPAENGFGWLRKA
jgi:hypothetical protein